MPHETMESMAKERVRDVVKAMNLDLSLKLDKVMFESLLGLWAEWIEMGVPQDLMDTFYYKVDLVEYLDNSTLEQGANPVDREMRDVAQDVTIVMSMDVDNDVRVDGDGKMQLVISCDQDNDVVRYAYPNRPTWIRRPFYIPRGNGRLVWVLGEQFPMWRGAEACRAHLPTWRPQPHLAWVRGVHRPLDGV